MILEEEYSISSPVISRCPRAGSEIMLAACFPSRQMVIEVPHSGSPEAKFSVPSIGSTTAVQPERS